MRKFCKILSAPFLLVLAVSVLSQGSQAQVVQDRIAAPIESAAGMAKLVGTLHPLAKPEFDQGLADNSKVLQGMSINFKRTGAQEAALKALLQAQQDPASSSYHKWLTQAQFGQQFGMSQADLDKVSAWLQQEGFTITFTAQSKNAIHFSGSIASVEKAFQTQIHNYSVNGVQHYANATQISLPSALAGLVSNVRGLDDFKPKPRIQFARSRQGGSNAHFTSGTTGEHYLAPPDFVTIYDLGPLYTAGLNGTGITIAVMGQTDIVPADITDFRSTSGLSVNNPTVFTVPGTTPESVATGDGGDLAETDLDLEWSGAVAPNASIILVNSDSVFDSLDYVIEEPINGITVPIISQSYGACEAAYSTANISQIEFELEQANGQGQTVVLAAGDTGAADCDNSTATNTITSATQGLAVDYPGSSAFVTDVGGSEFMGDGTATAPETGAGTYWSANGSNDLLSSAKSYIPEMAWNDTTFNVANGGGLDGGGGGASSLFPKPTWQAGVSGIPADSARDVPDISLAASNDHDGYLYCTQVQPTSGAAFVSSCQTNSFRTPNVPSTNDQNLIAVAGGTSFAAPTFAGILAILEQKLAGGGLGNIDPALYTLASNSTTYASAFHDITTGNNQVPCTTGSPDCPSGNNPVIGYVAGTGYDQATGLGSLDADKLVTAYSALVTTTGTKTTLAVTPGTSLGIGESATFTATVTPNTLSTAPTGTVTFIVDGNAKGAPTLSTASPFTATFSTSFAAAGTHTVYVTYSGDSAYTQSTSSIVSVKVVSQGTQPTTTTVVANPTSFPLGASLTLTATITGSTAGTLTGPVTFTTGGTTIGTVKQVTLATGDTATAVLSVSAATASLGFVAGTDTITASYGGDSYNAVSSGTVPVTVTNPGITVSATNITISSPSPGNSGTSTITLTSTGGYSGTANVTASGSANVEYGFGSSGSATASIVLSSGGTGTTTITITTVAATGNLKKRVVADLRKNGGRIAAAGGTAAGCLLLLLMPGIRRKRWPAALIMLVFLSVGAGLGCGGGTGGGAPSGSYTITVTATDSSNSAITGSGTFTVTIQ